MAQQTGPLTLRKAVGNVSFYNMGGKRYARQKTNIPREVILTDPRFLNTRKNMSEFGRASELGRLLRDTFSAVVGKNNEVYVAGMLTKLALVGIQADTTNNYGDRNIVDGNPAIFVGFQFNEQAPMDSIFHAPYTLEIDRVAGEVVMTIPIFVPDNEVNADPAATHFRIGMEGAEINLVTDATVIDPQFSAWIPLGSTPTTLITLTSELTAASTDPIYAAVSVTFAKLVSGDYNVLYNKAYASAFIAAADV